MIERKDFIIAQLEQIGVLLAGICRRRIAPDQSRFEEQFNECLNVFDTDLDSLRQLPASSVIDALTDPRRLAKLMEILSLYLSQKSDPKLEQLREAVADHLLLQRTVVFTDIEL